MSIASTRLARLFWVFFEKFGLVSLSIVSFFIFASYLTPAELGLGILLLSAVEFSSMFLIAIVDSSIIRLKNITKEHDGTAFWLLLIISSILAAFIYIMYYLYFDDKTILLTGLLAVFLLPLQAMTRVHIIHLRRNKSFKQLANRTILGKLAGMIVGIYLAIKGFGELAVVAQATIMSAVSTLLLFLSDRRSLPFVLDLKWAKEQLMVGLPASLKVLNTNLYTKGTIFAIEGTLGTQAVGLYNFANRLVELPRDAILTALTSYAHPVFSEKKNQGKDLTDFFLASTKISLMVVLPMFVGLALVAEPIVELIFKDQWLPSVPILVGVSILASLNLTFLFLPSVLLAHGQNKLGLKGQIASSLIAFGLLIPLLSYFGLIGVVYSLAIRIAIILPVSFYAMIEVAPKANVAFFKICLKTLLPCLIMAASINIVKYLLISVDIISLLLQVIAGVITYGLSYFALNTKITSEIKSFITK